MLKTIPSLLIAGFLTNVAPASTSDSQPVLAPGPDSPLAVPGSQHSGPIAIGALTKDGHQDLVIGTENGVTVLLGDGTGRFRSASGSPIAVPADTGNVTEVALGDVNHDGKLDLVFATHDSYAVNVLLGNGDGSFTSARGSPFPAQDGRRPHTHGMTLADVNNDGNLDILVAQRDDGDVAVLLGDGKGGFVRAPSSPFRAQGAHPFAVADVNGDGNLDLVVPNSDPRASPSLTILFGDGKGGFSQRPGSLLPATGIPYFVTAGDLTGRHRMDLVATHSKDRFATVLLNDGRGGFTPAPGSPLDLGERAWWAALADFNHDGKLDLVVAGMDSVRVFLGDGSGGFHAAPGSPFVAAKGTWHLAVGDINRDGNPDVVATSEETGHVTVLLAK